MLFVNVLGPVVQSVVSLTSSLRVISLTVLVDLIDNILIFLLKKCEYLLHCKSYSHFFSKIFQHICLSLDVNFNESLTNDIVSFEKLGPVVFHSQMFYFLCWHLSQLKIYSIRFWYQSCRLFGKGVPTLLVISFFVVLFSFFWRLNCICPPFSLLLRPWWGGNCISSWVHLFTFLLQ